MSKQTNKTGKTGHGSFQKGRENPKIIKEIKQYESWDAEI